MPTDALDRLERLFRAALLHPPEERADFLGAACDDDALRREVESLLAADAASGDFLDPPATNLLGDARGLGAASGAPDALVGHAVGPYRVLRPLGEGGMGAVYLAVRKAPFQRYVALKIVRAGHETPDVLRRFEQERQILASLNHPNIARLLDGGMTDDGRPYFVMEYVEGRPITAYADEHRLSIEERLALFRAVCDAVHYAHQNLVLHRDLKPSNIMVATDGADGKPTVKLLDFGIAKLLNPNLVSAASPVTRTLPVMTPEYASPEQVRGEPLSTASDVYSLGVVLYELLSGHRPYRLTHGTPAEVVRVVCEAEPERPSTKVVRDETVRRGDGPEATVTAKAVGEARDASPERLRRRLRGDLDAIVLKALRKEPQRRYASAGQLDNDLDRFAAGTPVLAHRDSRTYRLRKFVRRHRGSVAAAAAVVLALVGGLSVALWQASEAREERDRTAQALRQSEEMAGFLMSLFEASDPDEAQGDTLTAAALLDRGVRRTEALSDEPTVQARMLVTIGQVYRSLGRYEESVALHERALAFRRAAYGEEHEEVAQSLLYLADALIALGQYREANTDARRALAIQRRVLGPDHPEIGATLAKLSGLAVYLGDLDASVALARQALAVREEALGRDDPAVGLSWSLLGRTIRRQGDTAGAEEAFRQALAIAHRHYGPEHPDVASAMLQLAYTLRDTGRLAEAERLHRQALDVRRRTLGERHPMVAYATGDLAFVLSKQGRHEEALELYQREVEMLELALGPEHPTVFNVEGARGQALLRAGRLDEAEAVARDVLARMALQRGDGHPALGGALAGLAAILAEQGAYEEAEAHYREAIAVSRSAVGADNPDSARLTGELATVLARQRRYPEAEAAFRRAEAVFRQRHVSDAHGEVQDFLRRFAEMYDAWGRPADAARYRARLAADEDGLARHREGPPAPVWLDGGVVVGVGLRREFSRRPQPRSAARPVGVPKSL